MKRSLTAAVLVLALFLTAAWARGEDAGLISLSYLEGSFSQSLDAAISARLDAADEEVRASLRQQLSSASVPLKQGDVLSGPAGLAFTLLEGEVSVSGGKVVDVTAGRETGPGPLESGHRYIAAEDAELTVNSPSAVAAWEGPGTLVPSDQPDCYAIAKALQTLGLFRGSGSGIGEGFDLDRAPTRGEGLVLFLRLLGEEDAALACTDAHPFTDVPSWLDPYVAWAYARGYSNGVSADRFDPGTPISAIEYVELLLRALGWSTAGTDDASASLERALDCGVLTDGEYAFLTALPFRRAHAAYLSYYSLDAAVSGTGRTLAQRMAEEGLLTADQMDLARSWVKTSRLD